MEREKQEGACIARLSCKFIGARFRAARERDINQNNNPKKLRQSKVLIFCVRKIIRAFLRHLPSYDFISRSNTPFLLENCWKLHRENRPIQLGIVPSIYLIF